MVSLTGNFVCLTVLYFVEFSHTPAKAWICPVQDMMLLPILYNKKKKNFCSLCNQDCYAGCNYQNPSDLHCHGKSWWQLICSSHDYVSPQWLWLVCLKHQTYTTTGDGIRALCCILISYNCGLYSTDIHIKVAPWQVTSNTMTPQAWWPVVDRNFTDSNFGTTK